MTLACHGAIAGTQFDKRCQGSSKPMSTTSGLEERVKSIAAVSPEGSPRLPIIWVNRMRQGRGESLPSTLELGVEQ